METKHKQMGKALMLLFVIFSSISLTAQDCFYDFSVSTGTYQDLNNPISLNNGTVWDDPSYSVPIGFDFEVCGNVYHTLYISDSGSGGSLFSEENPEGTISIITPINQDIVDNGQFSGTSQSPLSYKISGTNGNHILKIEWKNVGFWGIQNDYMNFQVWLYENTNSISFHYGSSSILNPDSFDGENGPVIIFYPLVNLDTDSFVESGYLLTGSPMNPSVIVVDDNTSPPIIALNGMVPSGTIYTFTPDNLSVNDSEKIDFSVYPNPVNDILFFRTKVSFEHCQIEIYTTTGKKVKTISSIKKNQINVSELNEGLYFMKINRGNEILKTIKIIKW